jgi:FtsP/CotA-like multicopper oxidase with cupredoxin domain
MKRNFVLSIVAIAALIAAAVFLALNPSANSVASTAKSQVTFTIIASRMGYNGSVNMGTPWPVMTVHQGQSVTIHVKNEDPVEPHGFTVTHYLDSGATLRPGETYTLTFLADQKGTFRVYCDIFCTIHVYMQNGRLTVE